MPSLQDFVQDPVQDPVKEAAESSLILRGVAALAEAAHADDDFKRLVEALPQGITVVRNDRFTYVNPAAATNLGYDTPAALIGQPSWMVLHPDELRARREVATTLGPAGAESDPESGVRLVRCLKRDGKEILLESMSLPLRFEDGPSVLSISWDVTRERRAEAEAGAVTSLWRAILDGAEHSIIATTPQGTIREFNPASERMLGYRADEVVGLFSPAIIHDVAEVVARAQALTDELDVLIEPGFEALVANARRGQPDHNEWTYLRKDGSRFPVRLSVTALRGPGGEIDGFIGIAADITEAKRAESELIKAKDAAERAMRTRADFLARMSHEIRTPMNGILGMTELALQTRLTGEQRDYLETTESSARTLLSLINDILDFSKIDSGKLRLETIPFRPEEVFGVALRALAVLAQRKGLELLIDVAPDVPRGLLGDPQRLAQILTNLVGNAIKFTDRGDIAVRLRIARRDGDLVQLEVEVQDNGIGIPLEKQAFIFEAFSQVDEATTRHYGGTGLGLAICAQLVQLMGGEISVLSALGDGSRFSFRVPLRMDPNAPAVSPTPARVMGLHALVVDDHPVQRSLVETMLRSWQIDVLATSGGDCLDRARQARAAGAPVSLIILDAAVARADQGVLVSRLRAESAPGAGLLLLGGMDQAAIGDAELRIGDHALVSKPVLASALLEGIEALLAGPPHATPARFRTATPSPLPPPATAPLRILVADDNAINRKVVNGMLARAGHHVTTVDDGSKALAAIAHAPFDVVLMDVEMPSMDGFEATRMLRERGIRIPIVALTAQAMKGDEERCLAAGMDAYLSKPIDRAALLTVLARVTPGDGGAAADSPADLAPSESPAPPEPPPFDEAELLDRIGGDRELVVELMGLFLRDGPPMFARVQDAAAAGDARRLEQAAHGLASMLLNLSAHRASVAARALERCARANNLGDAPTTVGLLEVEMKALHAHFTRHTAP